MKQKSGSQACGDFEDFLLSSENTGERGNKKFSEAKLATRSSTRCHIGANVHELDDGLN